MRSALLFVGFLGVFAACGGKIASVGPSDASVDQVTSDAHPTPSDAKPPIDGTVPPIDASTLVCPPQPVTTITNAWRPPKRTVGACTTNDIGAFWTACLSPQANQQKCKALQSSSPACIACLTSSEPDPTWGPLVAMGQGDLLLNEAGCVALVTGDATPSSCAVKEYLLRSCALASCADCPLDGPEDVPNWDACMQASTGSTCASYAGPAACVQKVAPQCVNGSDFGTRFQTIAPLFCGP